MTTQEKIAVMQAWVDGKIIQYKDGSKWNDFHYCEPSWDWIGSDYRIKPDEPTKKIVPFESADEFYEALCKHGGALKSKSGVYYYPNTIYDKGIVIVQCEHYYDELAHNFTFADGTPCGKEVEI